MVREKSVKEAIMGIPLVYQMFQDGIRKPTSDVFVARDIIRGEDGMSILDVGCGVARIRKSLGNVDYVGIDHNPRYISKAKQKHGDSGRFFVADVSDVSQLVHSKFDRVILIGVLHHLNDESSRDLVSQASLHLKPGGHLVTYDPTFVPNQHPISFLVSRFDRGRFVRTPEAYLKLFDAEFSTLKLSVRHDLLRIPSATAIIVAKP
jgi:2-polyprenyl-3-methyl-5-hydroxy-6-metoxy-1,4-benzoquinol methylase